MASSRSAGPAVQTSDGQIASVDDQRRAGDVGRHGRAEEDDRTDQFLRLAEPRLGIRARNLAARAGSLRGGGSSSRWRWCRGDGIDADAARGEFLRQVLGQHPERRLGRRIAEGRGGRDEGGDGRDVDDAAAGSLQRRPAPPW